MAKYLTLFSAIHWKKRSPAKRRGKGRVRRRRRGDNLVAPEIPLDLQIEILKRSPSKSLMRFKCVSKLWSFLIRSRYFSNLYCPAASPPRQPRLYMSLLQHVDCDSMEVCQNPGKSRLLALSSSCNGADESLEPFLTIQGMGGLKMVILRGLILYTVCRRACIYNPTTRQSVTLPPVKSIIFAQGESHDKYVHYFLGHDPILDQYKVVCNVVTFPKEDSGKFDNLTSEHWVFVLEAGGSWKKIEFDQPPAHVSTRLGLCINGVIYYSACTRTACQIVISFDVRSEEFSMIQAPQLGESVGFIEYDGKPTIFDHTYLRQNGLVDLWVMEDGGKWFKKSLVLQASQMHLVKNDSIEELSVECRTQKGEIILVPKPCPSHSSYFLYYDMQKNYLRKVNVSGILGHEGFRPLCFSFSHMDQHESIMHLEI